ncbi:MAG: DUF523 domain-containing protein [Gammaproteobacteria bacterium]|nr:DUF523 domain-containing protein [Gammaproteobacteria bacterium]
MELTLGLSSCLAGNAVRYDGDDSYNPKIMREIGEWATFEVICPEMAIGLGVPRKPIQLRRHGEDVRVQGVDNPQLDVTDALLDFARQISTRCDQWSGYILKKGSPSCGMHGVRIMDASGQQQLESGQGKFAQHLQQLCPTLPMIDEWQLADSQQYDQFIQRVLARWQWLKWIRTSPDLAALRQFHQRFALSLLLRDPQAKYDLDAWLDERESLGESDLAQYFLLFMTALNGQADVLQRSLALNVYAQPLASEIEAADWAALQELLSEYGAGIVPLSFVLGALRQLVVKHQLALWQDCVCLFPDGVEQRLRYPV